MTETRTLALAVDRTRAYTRYYLKHLHGTDPHRVFELNGAKLNSAHWIVAHLTVTQNLLLLRSTDGPFEKFSWAKHFNLGSVPPAAELCPPFEEVQAMFAHVHEKALAHVATLTTEQLDQPHTGAVSIAGIVQRRDAVIHHLRHENLHTGQLAWLCKLNGVKTV